MVSDGWRTGVELGIERRWERADESGMGRQSESIEGRRTGMIGAWRIVDLNRGGALRIVDLNRGGAPWSRV